MSHTNDQDFPSRLFLVSPSTVSKERISIHSNSVSITINLY